MLGSALSAENAFIVLLELALEDGSPLAIPESSMVRIWAVLVSEVSDAPWLAIYWAVYRASCSVAGSEPISVMSLL